MQRRSCYFLVARPIASSGSWSRDRQTAMGDGTTVWKNGSGSVEEPKVRIQLPPALSPSQRGPADAVANLGGGHAGTVKPHPVVGSCVGCGSESDTAPDASLPWVRRGCDRA